MPHIPKIRIVSEGGRYYLDYYFAGDRIRRCVGPETKAMKELAGRLAAKLAHEIAEGVHFPERRATPDPRLREFAEEYLAEHAAQRKSERRIKQCLAHLKEAFGDRRLSEISRRDVERYQARRAGKAKPATVNRELAILKNLFNKAIEWEKTGSNPVRGVRFLKENNARVRYITDEEATKLLPECPAPLRVLVVFARNTGMRLGEIIGLRWRDIDLQTGFAHVREAKSGEGRKVPLNATAVELLKALPRSIRGELPVFVGPEGGTLRQDWVTKRFAKACADAEILDLHFHVCRHDCASRLVMKGRSLEEVRRVLGHKTLAMTARYAHLSPGHLLDVVKALDEPSAAAQPAGVDTAMDTKAS